MTKKEIVRQIAERISETQLKTKDIVQRTFDAIVDTLISEGRIELRNFGVFEVKERKARKARNPRTGERVDVPPKFVVTFKPGKEMEERVRQLSGKAPRTPAPTEAPESEPEPEPTAGETTNGTPEMTDGEAEAARPRKPRKTTPSATTA